MSIIIYRDSKGDVLATPSQVIPAPRTHVDWVEFKVLFENLRESGAFNGEAVVPLMCIPDEYNTVSVSALDEVQFMHAMETPEEVVAYGKYLLLMYRAHPWMLDLITTPSAKYTVTCSDIVTCSSDGMLTDGVLIAESKTDGTTARMPFGMGKWGAPQVGMLDILNIAVACHEATDEGSQISEVLALTHRSLMEHTALLKGPVSFRPGTLIDGIVFVTIDDQVHPTVLTRWDPNVGSPDTKDAVAMAVSKNDYLLVGYVDEVPCVITENRYTKEVTSTPLSEMDAASELAAKLLLTAAGAGDGYRLAGGI